MSRNWDRTISQIGCKPVFAQLGEIFRVVGGGPGGVGRGPVDRPAPPAEPLPASRPVGRDTCERPILQRVSESCPRGDAGKRVPIWR